MVRRAFKVSIGERTFDMFNYIIISIFMLICIYPFYYVVIYSVSNAKEAIRGVYLIPSGISFATYAKVFSTVDLANAFFISISRTVLGTILCVFFSSMFAYLITHKEMPFRRFVYRFAVITMYMNAGLIPYYITMKAYGLKNNFLLYIIPGLVCVFYVVLVKTFIEQLPSSIEESAVIDGAGFFTVFIKVIFPLCKPIIATITVYAAVGAWNAWMDNYLLVNNPKLQTLQLILYNCLNEAQALASMMRNQLASGSAANIPPPVTPESVRTAITVITVAPIMLVYPFLQRYFIKGIMMGAIKG